MLIAAGSTDLQLSCFYSSNQLLTEPSLSKYRGSQALQQLLVNRGIEINNHVLVICHTAGLAMLVNGNTAVGHHGQEKQWWMNTCLFMSWYGQPSIRIVDLIIDRASLDRAQIVTDIVSDINVTILSSESLSNGLWCTIVYHDWSITEMIEGKKRDVELENPTTGQTRT